MPGLMGARGLSRLVAAMRGTVRSSVNAGRMFAANNYIDESGTKGSSNGSPQSNEGEQEPEDSEKEAAENSDTSDSFADVGTSAEMPAEVEGDIDSDIVLSSFKEQQRQLRGVLDATDSLSLPSKNCSREEAERFMNSIEQHYSSLQIPSHVERLEAELTYRELCSNDDARAYADELGQLAYDLNVQDADSVTSQVYNAVINAEKQLDRSISLSDDEGMDLVDDFLDESLRDEGNKGLFDDLEDAETDAYQSRVGATHAAIEMANLEAEQGMLRFRRVWPSYTLLKVSFV